MRFSNFIKLLLGGTRVLLAVSVVGGGHPLAFASQFAQAPPLNVDLRDIIEHQSGVFHGLDGLLIGLEQCPRCYLPAGFSYLQAGPSKLVGSQKTVLSIYLWQNPELIPGRPNFFRYFVKAVLKGESNIEVLSLVVVQADHEPEPESVEIVATASDYLNLNIELSLYDRAMRVFSDGGEYERLFPLGVGGFDENGEEIKAPRGSGLHLVNSPDHLIEARFEPIYYYGFPFLQILNASGQYFGYGFHGTLQPTKPLRRGFISTGCIRMQIKDLYELYYVMFLGVAPWSKIPIEVGDQLLGKWQALPHPYYSKTYARAVDGSKGSDGLTKMKTVNGPPPVGGN